MRPAEAAPTAPRRPLWSQVSKVLVSIVLGVLLINALRHGGVPLVPPASAFARVSWWAVAGHVGLLSISWYMKGVRWRLLLKPVAKVSGLEALNAVSIGQAAVLLLPFRLGETVRPLLIARGGRVSVLAALGTVVAERIIDGLVVALILGAALLSVPTIVPLPAKVVGIPIPVSAIRGYAWTFLIVFTVAFAVIVAFHAARDFSVKIIHLVFGRISPRLAKFIAATLERFSEGLSFFRDHTLGLQFLLETLAYWLFFAVAVWLLGWGTGVVHADGASMSFGEACALLGMLGIAASLPGPPGLIGLFQAGALAAMTMYYPKEIIVGPGSAFVFLLYVIQVGFTVLAAVVALGLNAVRRPSDTAG